MVSWKFWEGSNSEAQSKPVASQEAQKTAEMINQEMASSTNPPKKSSTQHMDRLRAISVKDIRNPVMDINEMGALEAKYMKEMIAADAHMNKRAEDAKVAARMQNTLSGGSPPPEELDDFWKGREVVRTSVRGGLLPTYSTPDKRYAHWLEEQKHIEETMRIHWIDKATDNPTEMAMYSLRVCTTLGIIFGLGRSAYLWRTFDKKYAKIHGVTLTSILVFEVSASVVKFGIISVLAAMGYILGDSLPNAVRPWITGDVTYHPREWYNIGSGGAVYGLLFGKLVTHLNKSHFTYRQATQVTYLSSVAFGIAASVVGKLIYDPYVNRKEDLESGGARYDTKNPRPWNEKIMATTGPRYVRGRYN